VPGRGLPGAQRLGLPAQRAQPIGQLVTNAFERTEVQQAARGAVPPGRRREPVGKAGAHGRAELCLELGDLVAEVAPGHGLADLGEGDLRRDVQPGFAL